MLFLKPLSVHSRSIMWRPKRREKTEGGRGTEEGEEEEESRYMTDSISAAQDNVIELG